MSPSGIETVTFRLVAQCLQTVLSKELKYRYIVYCTKGILDWKWSVAVRSLQIYRPWFCNPSSA